MTVSIKMELSSGSSGQSHSNNDGSQPRVIEDIEYPALLFPGYSEKPLSEQLEPLAVIGMGTWNDVVLVACLERRQSSVDNT